MRRIIGFWMANARSSALPQSLMPAAVAVILSVKEADFSLFLALLAMAGVGAAHLAFNLLDDLFDYISHQTGYRQTLARAGFRAYTRKCPYLTEGKATLIQLGAACCVFGLLAIGCGSVIFFFRGQQILWVAGITGFLGFFYSGKPLRFSYHGLGEPIIGIIFGPLNMAGVSLASAGKVTDEVFIIGIAMGLLVANILYTHSVLDYAADQTVKKNTMAAWFPTEKERLGISLLFIFLPDVILFAGIIMGKLSVWYCLTVFTIPYGWELYHSLCCFTENPQEEVCWKWWYGPSKRFYMGRELGIEWFLQRWLLARNLLVVTSLCCIIASVIM